MSKREQEAVMQEARESASALAVRPEPYRGRKARLPMTESERALAEALVLAAQHTARSGQDHSHLWVAANRAARALGLPEAPPRRAR